MEWEIGAVIDAYRDGEKIDALAAEFNIAKTTITKRARRAGLPARTSRERRIENLTASARQEEPKEERTMTDIKSKAAQSDGGSSFRAQGPSTSDHHYGDDATWPVDDDQFVKIGDLRRARAALSELSPSKDREGD